MTQRTLPMREWFERIDREFRHAVQCVMTARTTADPTMGGMGSMLDWSQFRDELARLERLATERHAAKHAAEREAIYDWRPMTISLGDTTPPEGDQ